MSKDEAVIIEIVDIPEKIEAFIPVPSEIQALVARLNNLHEIFRIQGEILSISPIPEGFLDRFLPPELRKHRFQKRLD